MFFLFQGFPSLVQQLKYVNIYVTQKFCEHHKVLVIIVLSTELHIGENLIDSFWT